MIEKINEMMEALLPDIIKQTQRLVSIYSVRSEPEVDAPFGDGPKNALIEALLIAKELGFDTKNIDNIVGYAQYGDGDGEYVGIFAHVDVVEIGEGWNHDPLGDDVEDGRIFGRGVLDNKGPLITNLYALYAMKKLGIEFRVPVRIVFGTNEETGFGCVKHYLTKEKAPLFGWTPDCKWPVVYGERGRALVRFNNETSTHEFFRFLNEYILSSPNNGVKLGINVQDDHFGELVMRGYSLGVTVNGNEYFQMALSYPSIKGIVELGDIIQSHLPSGIVLEVVSNWDPVIYDLDPKFIEPLTDSYERIMGGRLESVTTTGGTYAKIIPNIIAYGPSFPGQKDIAHLPDEWMDLGDMLNCAKIYAGALYRLSEVL